MTITEINQLPGVGPVAEEKLKASGYTTLMSIAVASIPELAEVSGLSEKVCRKLTQEARDAMNLGFEDGDIYENKKEDIPKLKSGYEPLDTLLGGGIDAGGITEIYGRFGSNKSNLCFLYSVVPQITDPKAQTIFIATEGKVSGKRIKDFAIGFGLNPDKALKNVKIVRTYSLDHQELMIDKTEEMLNNGVNIKLIVIDSLTSHLRVEFQARGTLAVRQQRLNRMLHKLIKIADMNSIPIIVTNQVMADPSGFMYSDPIRPVGGEILGHMVTTRIYLRKAAKGNRMAKLVDSPHLPDGEVLFLLEETRITEPVK